MADPAVSFLLEKLPRLLYDELKLLSGVEDKINSLYSELKFIDIFLKSSIDKRSDELVKEVVNQVRDVAFKAEDVVDIYVAKVAKHRSRNVLSKLFHMPQHVMVLHEVDTEIDKIKNRIIEIYDNREKYGITQGGSTGEDVVAAAESLRERRRHVEEEHVVGLVRDSKHVIQQLMESDSGCKVVSIIGMGGLGKTTLARKIYNNSQVKELFPCRAWGYVSNDYRAKELLLSLLKCWLSTSDYSDLKKKIKEDGEAISEEELKMKVGECLNGKKYLVVLDDIWKTQVWDDVKGTFPDDKNGSRILITSRRMEVAHYTGTMSPYQLQTLNDEESWELFSKNVFRGKECPAHLEPLGRSIVKSCKGLPLAIVVLAGFVAKKEKSEGEWLRIRDISWHLTKDRNDVMDILKLSYDSLPRELKPCFLYFGIYPEDYEIKAKELIRLWIAEGFITRGQNRKEIADSYLNELVDRNLVQEASSRIFDGGVKTCRIHDLFRELCISESKSDKFLEVCTDLDDIHTLSNASPRRLSFACDVSLWSYISTNKFDQSSTRSLFFFSDDEDYSKNVEKSVKLARVLYSKCKGRIDYPLRIDWKKMIHIRFLRIDEYMDIPASISSLWNLETLQLGHAGTISSEIWKLKQLKHVLIWGAKKVAVLPESQRKIKGNLQTLWLSGHDDEGMVSLLNNDVFPRLRKFTFNGRYYTSRKSLPSLKLHHLSNLHSLKMTEVLQLDANVFPSNLTKITLEEIFVMGDMTLYYQNIKTLAQLANLQSLKLVTHYTFPFDLNFGAGEFQKLKVFQMTVMPIRSWKLEGSAMPSLQNLLIQDCRYLSELPKQLWSLTTLQQVHVMKPTRELADNLKSVKLQKDCKLILDE